MIVSGIRLCRQGLEAALAAKPDLQVVGSFDPAQNLTAEALRLQANVVLVDISGVDGIATLRQLCGVSHDLKVVAFATSDLADELLTCAELGVSGYVPKSGSVDDVVAAVRSALRGELTCSPMAAARLVEHIARLATGGGSPPRDALTPRECEVAELLDAGLSNKEIARKLRIEHATVKNHVHSILDKLQVHKRGQAVARLRSATARMNPQPAAAWVRPVNRPGHE
jgi:two-component system, NarL family, nitrate/nitrite response regulator NarL